MARAATRRGEISTGAAPTNDDDDTLNMYEANAVAHGPDVAATAAAAAGGGGAGGAATAATATLAPRLGGAAERGPGNRRAPTGVPIDTCPARLGTVRPRSPAVSVDRSLARQRP